MKLFARYNRINLLATVVVFLLSSVAYFFLLKFILTSQVDDDLIIEQHEITSYVQKYQALPEVMKIKDQRIMFNPVFADGGKRKFSDVRLPEEDKSDTEIYRQLVFYMQVKKQWYEISVNKSMEGTDGLIRTIGWVTLLTILLILVISVIINRVLLQRLWQPFYQSLDIMRQFELGRKEPMVFPPSNIDEFTMMNDTLQDATAKAGRDYLHLKEFTENASHELQTPLAIIQSKLDLLMQDEALNHSQSNAIQGAYEAVQRLSKLNQGLLLLTKIENGQFNLTSPVDFTEKIKEKIFQFEELLQASNISIQNHCATDVKIIMNPLLADIVLNNLFSNALKHNRNGGMISIQADGDRICFGNSGDEGALDSNRLFNRFSKNTTHNEGAGLGLAIMKEALNASGFAITYYFQNNMHYFCILLSAPESPQNRVIGLQE